MNLKLFEEVSLFCLFSKLFHGTMFSFILYGERNPFILTLTLNICWKFISLSLRFAWTFYFSTDNSGSEAVALARELIIVDTGAAS